MSPIASLAQVSLDAEGGAGMSEAEHTEKVTSPGSTGFVRSASPAKRSAADMEGEDKAAQNVPGSFEQESNDTQTHFDEAMAGVTPVQSGDADTQAAVEESGQTSAQESMTTDTSATSLQSEELPAYSVTDTSGETSNMDTPSIDEQVRIVTQLAQAPNDEGQIGFVVSSKWLARVVSRSTDGLKDSAYSKDAREGPIGPIDNSDIVPHAAFGEPHVKDEHKKLYIPLKQGLTLDENYQLLPEKAWGKVLGWYGLASAQKQIVRYAHNTAPPDAVMPNIMYEMYPPLFTIRKVPQDGNAKPSPSHRSTN